jgi:hypothetical protein
MAKETKLIFNIVVPKHVKIAVQAGRYILMPLSVLPCIHSSACYAFAKILRKGVRIERVTT